MELELDLNCFLISKPFQNTKREKEKERGEREREREREREIERENEREKERERERDRERKKQKKKNCLLWKTDTVTVKKHSKGKWKIHSNRSK